MSLAPSNLLMNDPSEDVCGEDLAYDASFLVLQHAAVGKREQQFGSTIIPAEAPDWHQVEKLADALGERSVDVRIMVYMAQACAEQYGLGRYAQVLKQIAQMLEQQWEGIHPRLDVDGEDDPLPRMNALAALGDAGGAARSARDAVLLKTDYGQARLRDVEAVLDSSRGQPTIDYPGGRARLVEDLQSAYVLRQESVAALPSGLAALRRIRAIVRARLSDAWVPDFSALERSFETVVRALALVDDTQHTERSDAIGAEQDGSGQHAGASGSGQVVAELHDGSVAGHGAGAPTRHMQAWRDVHIVNRADATAMLEKVSLYFETHEPSHPAPLLIRRIQQLIPLGFYDIVKNLAPQGVGDVEGLMVRTPSSGPSS